MISEMCTSAIFLWQWQGGGCVSGLGMSADQAGYRLHIFGARLLKCAGSVHDLGEAFD